MKPDARPPIETEDLVQSDPKTWAVGAPAVISSLQQVFSKAGVIRGTKALHKLNQAGGFDCPSCAWPDPDGERSVAEF